MNEMFCFQCEQTSRGTGCTGKAGVCGKKSSTSNLLDRLTGALILLARAAEKGEPTTETNRLVMESLFMAITNVNFNDPVIEEQRAKIIAERDRLAPNEDNKPWRDAIYEAGMHSVWNANEDTRSLKSLILLGLRGMAAYALHAFVLDYQDDTVNAFFYEGLRAVGSDMNAEQLTALVLKTGEVNYKCMEILDKANTETYGAPEPVEVPLTIEKGPFIIITGHDLLDLDKLLQQSAGRGVNIYTHGEMLPTHGYPKLKAHPHFKGHFGTAWQNQLKEFDNVPAPILFTTNCLMPPRPSYIDRVFTTEVVSFPGCTHIGADKDFSPVIEKALELGGYAEDHPMTGINGGSTVWTGFGRQKILSLADTIIDAVKSGAIKRFFLIGGCDGAKPGRNYYTELAKSTPADTVMLTLACGKFRFNDIDFGNIGGIPRLLDMGQCNDSYGAIQVALALANAFDCSVNELPLSIILSWYEQKAVCVLLTLLYLGVKNIRLGPSLPAFVSPNILKFLVENFNITPISSVQEDLAACLA
ncbi:MAG: hydroxylamine reductase [Bradymonadales bacterium]|jgi:hydroxylamine reductase